MTGEAGQVLVLGDKAVADWLRDRFGIDVDKTLIGSRILIVISSDDAVRMHVSFLVGADDLAAFPLVEQKGGGDGG